MKLLLATTAAVVAAFALAAAWGQDANANNGLTVFVTNQSTVVTDAQLRDALPAFQAAVSQDLSRHWGVDANLYLASDPPAGAWTITVTDSLPACGCLGYHDLVNGTPVGFVGTMEPDKYNWQVTFTHELFEMLVDPYLNRLAIGTRLWLVEAADPVEDQTYAYQRLSASGDTVLITDFPLPAWYRRKSKGPWDFTGHCTHSEQVLQNGYVSYWTRNGWGQLYGRHTTRPPIP